MMPPSMSSRFSQGLVVSISDYALQNRDAGLWVTSSGKPTLRPFSWPGWKTRPWSPLQSGAVTFKPSMEGRGVASWIASLEAIRASRFPTQASDSAPKTNGISGRTSAGSSCSADRGGSSSRTSAATSRSASTSSTESYRALVTRLRRDYRARQKRARAMSASGCSSWPTPDTPGGGRTMPPGTTATGVTPDGRKVTVGLENAASMWPTAQAHDSVTPKTPEQIAAMRMKTSQRVGGGRPGVSNMNEVAALWPTPSASLTNDGEQPETFLARQEGLKAKGINGNGAGISLTVAVKVAPMPSASARTRPTASARDWKSGAASDETMERNARPLNEIAERWTTPRSSDGDKGGPNQSFGAGGIPLVAQAISHSIPPDLPTSEGGKQSSNDPDRSRRLSLNPIFVEWLMGWPLGWTDCGSRVMEWSLWLRRQRTALSMLSWNYEPVPGAEPEMRQMDLLA